MPRLIFSGVLTMAVAGMLSGCQNDISPAPQPARVPSQAERDLSAGPAPKPLPSQDADQFPAPPFVDTPLVSQQAPETTPFVQAYDHVGHPRILVWVAHSTGANYDETAARAIDYAAMENILTDWLAAGSRVAVIAPEAARQALDPQQAQGLDGGRANNAQDLTEKLRADVLVLVRAQPTRQSDKGPAVRVVADATNLRGGESLGRAVVDVPPPLNKPQINTYTRFVARKLMADMTASWNSFGADAGQPGLSTEPAESVPATQPATIPQTAPGQ